MKIPVDGLPVRLRPPDLDQILTSGRHACAGGQEGQDPEGPLEVPVELAVLFALTSLDARHSQQPDSEVRSIGVDGIDGSEELDGERHD